MKNKLNAWSSHFISYIFFSSISIIFQFSKAFYTFVGSSIAYIYYENAFNWKGHIKWETATCRERKKWASNKNPYAIFDSTFWIFNAFHLKNKYEEKKLKFCVSTARTNVSCVCLYIWRDYSVWVAVNMCIIYATNYVDYEYISCHDFFFFSSSIQIVLLLYMLVASHKIVNAIYHIKKVWMQRIKCSRANNNNDDKKMVSKLRLMFKEYNRKLNVI